MKRWIPNPIEQCEEHGADVEILTDAEQTIPGGVCAYDSDECRCSEGCKGWMTADDESFYCNWHDPVRSEPLLADDSQFLCTVCGQVGSVGRCCGLDTREPLNDLARQELERESRRIANSSITRITIGDATIMTKEPEIVCCRYLGTCDHALDPKSYCGIDHCEPHDRTETCWIFGCVPYPTPAMEIAAEMAMEDRARVDPVLTRDTQETPAQRGQHGRAK